MDPDGRKVSGILAEAEFAGGQLDWLIVGLGVNLAAAPSYAVILQPPNQDPAAFAERLLPALLRQMEEPESNILSRWRELSATLGSSVQIGELSGVAEDIAPDGALLLRTPEGLQRVLAGDVRAA